MKENCELLLELYSEEIPAMMQKDACISYKSIFDEVLKKNEIDYASLEIYNGPRRITIHIDGVPRILPSKEIQFKGPKLGSADNAIIGFCKSHNIEKSDLEIHEINGVQYYMYNKLQAERAVADILKTVLPSAISSHIWPKSMLWGDHELKWVRPLVNIMCIFDESILPFDYYHLNSNDITYGHFFGGAESKIKDFEHYTKFLKENNVMLSSREREKSIIEQNQAITKKYGLAEINDQALLEEVAGLVEWPNCLIGKLPDKFLKMPKEILIDSMRIHQKYFACFEKGGEFAPYFIFVSNNPSKDKEVIDNIIKGNEKVLAARLEDALYFYEKDLRMPLDVASAKTKNMVYHEKLGSLYDRSNRIHEICKFLNPNDSDAHSAALIAKADLVSEVVGEFPSLQGLMGYYFAHAQGKSPEIAAYIKDQYKPASAGDDAPCKQTHLLALADKIDALTGLMMIGVRATGSKDPFALRRTALGIIRIIIDSEMNYNLKEILIKSLDIHINQLKINNIDIDKVLNDIILFIEDRTKNYFKNSYSMNLINAVINLNRDNDLLKNSIKLRELKIFIEKDSVKNLIQNYKRASNIIENITGKADPSLFNFVEEKELHNKLEIISNEIDEHISEDNYSAYLKDLEKLASPIEKFFENVLVNDDDEKIAKNRKYLLSGVKQAFEKIAKFDLI